MIKNKRNVILFCVLIFSFIAGILLLRNRNSKSSVSNNHTDENYQTAVDSRFIMPDNAEIKSLDKDIMKFMRRWEIKGASFAIMKNDTLLYAKGYGYARVEDSTKCDIHHIFRIASVSKLVTAAAIMKLCESNQLSTDSKVFGEEGILNDTAFLNLKDVHLKDITVEHLLRHTSGLSRPHGDIAFKPDIVAQLLNKSLPISIDDYVKYATQCRVRAKAGTWYRYSNLGYILLSKIIEKVSGMGYEQYVRDSLLIPIGCIDMHLAHNKIQEYRKNEVYYYETKESKPIPAFDGSGKMFLKSRGGNDIRILCGAGGWVASPIELLKFVAAINEDATTTKLLSPKSIKYMTEEFERPIGWATKNKRELIRTGSMPGTSSIIKSEKDGYTWVFISNSSSWNGPTLTKEINHSISRAISRVKKWPMIHQENL